MKPKLLPLLERCIEDGLELGYNRAHKHLDNPTQHQIIEKQFDAIMTQIFEAFDFKELNHD